MPLVSLRLSSSTVPSPPLYRSLSLFLCRTVYIGTETDLRFEVPVLTCCHHCPCGGYHNLTLVSLMRIAFIRDSKFLDASTHSLYKILFTVVSGSCGLSARYYNVSDVEKRLSFSVYLQKLILLESIAPQFLYSDSCLLNSVGSHTSPAKRLYLVDREIGRCEKLAKCANNHKSHRGRNGN